jgi:hypothetical protein
VWLRRAYASAPAAVKAGIEAEAETEFAVVFPGLSVDSETGKKALKCLKLIITARKCKVRLPMGAGDYPVPWIPSDPGAYRAWKGRVNQALSNLTKDQARELENEIFRRCQDAPRNSEQVADEVRAQFTQIGGG